jgi:hypothetical protein
MFRERDENFIRNKSMRYSRQQKAEPGSHLVPVKRKGRCDFTGGCPKSMVAFGRGHGVLIGDSQDSAQFQSFLKL